MRLRDGRSLKGKLHVPRGQSLIGFLGMRRTFLNVTDVQWLNNSGGGERLDHLGVRLGEVVWVVPLDADFQLHGASLPPDASRAVELTLAGPLVLRVRIQIADEQRMSDYFAAHSDFIALRSIQIGAGSTVDRMAVLRDAILTIREV